MIIYLLSCPSSFFVLSSCARHVFHLYLLSAFIFYFPFFIPVPFTTLFRRPPHTIDFIVFIIFSVIDDKIDPNKCDFSQILLDKKKYVMLTKGHYSPQEAI